MALPDPLARLRTAVADRYRLDRSLGQGGMATVYLAHDLKHDRKVALKVLRPELAAVVGAERFVQEIRTTAALQHPHILPLFDSGSADGFLYYVMPYIEGETLREKLDRETQLAIEEALRIATEVAEALDYAHRHGVIHRDIKPENILLHDGRPLVADFGIALAVSAAAGERMTETGLSLGTPHYMSPEQATAEKEITARSDVYSLGSVLYEMLAGQPPHLGGSVQQLLMKIVAEPVAAVRTLRKSVPPNVAAALAKSLEKLPADRFATAKAFAEALGDPHFTATRPAVADAARTGSWRSWLHDPRTWAALVAIGVFALRPWGADRRGRDQPGPVRFTIGLEQDPSLLAMVPPAVFSDDSRHLAFVVQTTSGSRIYVRALDSLELTPVPRSLLPMFSPDGSSLAFLRDGSSQVWTFDLVRRTGAKLGVIPDAGIDIKDGLWHPGGRILVSGLTGIWALPAQGGEPVLLLAADSSMQEFRFGGLLPDARVLLQVRNDAGWHQEAFSPGDGAHQPIFPGIERARAIGDILVYSRSGQTWASRFDPGTHALVGQSVAIEDVERPDRSIAARVAVEPPVELVWVSRDGRATPLGVPAQNLRWPRLSPDGSRLAVGRVLEAGGGRILVNIDLRRRIETRLDGYGEPVWSPDGRTVYMSRGPRPLGGIVVQPSDGTRRSDTLLALADGDAWPTSVSPDGRWLAYYGADTENQGDPNDLAFLDLRSGKSRRLRLPGAQRGGRFSPDGRWVAYQSVETGRNEIHARPWPALDADFQISSEGGTEPAWSADGRELFYRDGDSVMAVALSESGVALERGSPHLLFRGPYSPDIHGDQSYDTAPDGRFLMLRTLPDRRLELEVVLNWITEVRARLEQAQ